MTNWWPPENPRWISADPAPPVIEIPETLNRYAYAVGDPINYIDADGRIIVCIGDLRAVVTEWGIAYRTQVCLAIFPPRREPPETIGQIIRPVVRAILTALPSLAFNEKISDSCKALFEEFIDAASFDPSLVENITFQYGGRTYTASADLGTLWTALNHIDDIRINRGVLVRLVTGWGHFADGVTFFNLNTTTLLRGHRH